MVKANDINLKSWLHVPEGSDFPIQNIPFGVFRTAEKEPAIATRIGDTVIDLSVLAEAGYFDGLGIYDMAPFYAPRLNYFIELGRETTSLVRNRIAELFSMECSELKDNAETVKHSLHDIHGVEMLMPVSVGDYTDFYSSIEHATNVGIMFRDPENALLPNWKHIPVGYHGRSSSIVVSGTDIHRPMGQTRADDADAPAFGPSRLMDFELEMAFITSNSTPLGRAIPIEAAEDYIFGLVLFNDLSARDIQKWEYVPLGPFLGKSFGSVISPWIVTLDALEPFRVDGPKQDPPVLPYLQFRGKKSFDIKLEVLLKPQNGDENLVCRSNFKYMYWNMAQQLAHQTVNGCNINPGDMYGSGTISGPTPDSYGSMLELSWKGTKPLKLSDGSERKFIQDHDTIIMRGYAQNEHVRIGFGEATTTILPAITAK
ncbi:MAG: fumarylacetoacetase [Bacteroidales bacterium]|jgi:fumarylacetoacetase|nr:fumarylacetoacetase [Bacteroidales bacterium]